MLMFGSHIYEENWFDWIKLFSTEESKQALRMILSLLYYLHYCITFCEGPKLWKLSTVLSTCHNWKVLVARLHRPLLCFKKIRTTSTTVFLISNAVVSNPCSHNTALDSQFLAPLSEVSGPLRRSVSVWYSNTLWASNS